MANASENATVAERSLQIETQFQNPGQDEPGKHGTCGHPKYYSVIYYKTKSVCA